MSGRSIRLTIGVLGHGRRRGRRGVRDEPRHAARGDGLLHLAIGLTYLYGGLVIWDHEPANRTGRLMTLVGLTWFIGTLIGAADPVVNELALALEDTSVDRPPRARPGLPERAPRDAGRSSAVAILAVGVTALNVLYSTSLPLIADKSTRPVRRAGPGDHDERRGPPAMVRSPRPARDGTCCRSSSPGRSSSRRSIINIVRRIADVPDDVSGHPRRREGPRAGGHPGRPADRLLSPERAPAAGDRRCHPGPDVPVRPRRPLHRRSGDPGPADSGRGRTRVIGRRLHDLMFAEAGRRGPGVGRASPRQRGAPGVRLLARAAGRPTRLRGADRAERARRGHRDRPRLHGPAGRGGRAATVTSEDRGGDGRRTTTARARPARRRPTAARLAVARRSGCSASRLEPPRRRTTRRSPPRRARPPSSRWRSRSCASSPEASIRRS